MSRVEHIGRATLYLGRCEEVLPTLGALDHIITDPPYSARTHARHDENAGKRRDNADAKALGYSALSEADARALAGLLGAHSEGWIAWLTDSELAPVIRKAFDALGRTTFPPLPFLQLLKERGDISDWEHEPHTFWFEKIKRGVRSYKPDFRVFGACVAEGYTWHEVKGWMDARSKTTLRRMAKYHPDEIIILVQERQYRKIGKNFAHLIQGWEAS